MLTDDDDIIIPWDRCFASEEEAMAALRCHGWQDPSPGVAYNERYWTLGATIRWIAERSQEAVDRPLASDAAVHRAVGELQEALEAGDVGLSGCLKGEVIPRGFSPETWGIHTVALRDDGNLLRPVVLDDGPDYDSIFRVRLRRDEVLRRWPPLDVSESVPPSTQGKETACKGWLTGMMRSSPYQRRPKQEVWAEASTKFPGLAKRAFGRAWTDAIKDSAADAWGRPGRRSQIKTPH